MTQPSPDVPAAQTTAEWLCARCGSTNRKLVPASARSSEDTCLRCHTPHVIEPNDRPVRWRARPKTT